MHVAVALAVGVGAFALIVLLAGLTPFIGIPLAVVCALVPVALFGIAGRKAADRGRLDKSGVPTSGQASYEPVVDPGERGPSCLPRWDETVSSR
jgi:hypothetical protein